MQNPNSPKNTSIVSRSSLKNKTNTPQSKSCTNINEILHFLSQKNATPQTNILWAQELRKDIDRQEFQKRLDRIPHKAPQVYDEQFSERRAYKKRTCPTDPDFNGNLTDIKHLTQSQKGYISTKEDVNFSSNLREYTINSKKIKSFRQKGKPSDLGFGSVDEAEKEIEISDNLKQKEKGWNSLPKIDRKEYFNFNVPKAQNIKESIKENNRLKYAQYKDYTPQYSILPKYNENFGDKNSVNFQHLKTSKNSQLKWMFNLRSYK